MKSHPLLYSPAMIRAHLRTENPKTQTRRLISDPPTSETVLVPLQINRSLWCDEYADQGLVILGDDPSWRCPYGTPGHEIWARETFEIT